MTFYPKMQTLFKRDPDNNYQIMEGHYSRKEFTNIKNWLVTEKIDGTNIRIIYDGEKVRFGGRTERAQIPTHLLDYLQDTFTVRKMSKAFPVIAQSLGSKTVTLFGEGYGPKIQKGGNYRDDVSFILFDVLIAETGELWWLEMDKIIDIAEILKIDRVPIIGHMMVDEIVNHVKGKPRSIVANSYYTMEGIVATAYPMVLFRNGNPLKFKLKVSDFT